jgi:hypothetical protein
MAKREDKDRFPCITIEMGTSPEKQDMRHMADLSVEDAVLIPNKIGKPIPYVVKPFVPLSYDEATGEIGIDQNLPGVDNIAVGMIILNPSNGLGYPITAITPTGVSIAPGTYIQSSQLSVAPSHQFYKARIEHSFFQETYNIGCHAHGDPQATLWLWSITLYTLLRYRESLLEANGFTESQVISSNVDLNSPFTTAGGERAWSRYITLTGQVENTWIKSPQRFIESVSFREKVKNSNKFVSGINVLSNLDTNPVTAENPNIWDTIQDSPDDLESV